MVITRTEGETDLRTFLPVLAQRRTNLSGAQQGLGIARPLLDQIAEWVIQAIGLGLSPYEAISGAKERAALVLDEEPTPGELRVIAEQIAAADPQHRPVSEWEMLVTEGGVRVPKKAGFEMPTWGWIALGVGGLLFVTKTGII